MSIRDTRLMARALGQRWPISENARKAIVGRLLKIVADPNSKPREVTAAAKAIMSADTANVIAERNEAEEDDDRRLRLLELAQRIPARELAQLASDNGIIVDGTAERRAAEPEGADGPEAGSGEGYQDPDSEEPEPPA